MKFYDWLMKTYHIEDYRDTPYWDIANEISIDPCFPKDVQTLDDCEEHLMHHNAPSEAYDVLEEVYTEYETKNKK